MNPFTLMSAGVRRTIYTAYGLAALAVSSVAAGYAATGSDVPSLVVGIGGALVPIGVLVGGTAVSNVDRHPRVEEGRHVG